MKPKSYWLAIAIALGMSMTSFLTPKTAQPASSRSADNAYYYFYTADDDAYQCYSNTSTEAVRLQTIYGVLVDSNPFGGTLVARGYTSNVYPHQIWPSVYMYAHF